MLTSNRRSKPINNNKHNTSYPNLNSFLHFKNIKIDKNQILSTFKNNGGKSTKNKTLIIDKSKFVDPFTNSSSHKIKNEDRNSSITKVNSKEKLNRGSKFFRNQIDNRQRILNPNPRIGSSEFVIELTDLAENKPDINKLLSSNSHAIRSNNISSNIKSFVSKNEKTLIRTFTLYFIDNKTNIKVEEVKVDKTLEKKITAMEFIHECHSKLTSNTIDLQSTKLILLNNMGLLMRIVCESEEINDLLIRYINKKCFLCFYILDIDSVLGLNNGITVCLQLMTKGFDSKNGEVDIHRKGNGIKPPVIIRDDNIMVNLQAFKKSINNTVKELYGENNFTKELKNESKFFINFSLH